MNILPKEMYASNGDMHLSASDMCASEEATRLYPPAGQNMVGSACR